MDIIRLSIKRPIFILMITLFMIVVGGLALRQLPVDLYPDVSYPVLAVRASLPGAAPEEVEQIVSRRLEDALSSLAGITTIRSISREGQANVILEFAADVDIKFQETQVRAKVANIRNSLPEDLSEPVVFRQDPDDTPIIEIAVTGNRTASELTRIADDQIAERLRQVPGAGEVVLGGEREQEVRVELKPDAIEAWRISTNDVVTAIQNFNGNDPVGNLKGRDRVWLLRSLSHVKSVDDLRIIPVTRTKDGDPIFLGDIADVTLGFAEVRRVSRLNDGKDLRPAITVEVSKQSGENTVAVSNHVLKAIDELRKTLPSDISITVTRDNADLVRTNVADVFETLIIGAILTIIVVLLFLRSPRATVTTGLSLPSSVITTFAIMFVAGFTINVMTLLALSLAIGLLVDDAIVVRENIFRHLQKNESDPAEAAYQGTKEVALAVVATTLTIVAVFLPVGFMGGTTGQFFTQFAVTVVFAILVSLWDALTMAPMLSTYFANIADPAREWKSFGKFGERANHFLERFEHWFISLETRYQNILAWILPRPKVAIGISAGALIVALLGFVFIGKSFVPAQLGPVFSAQLTGPVATPIERVAEVADQVDAKLRKVESIEHWTVSAGQGFGGSGSVNLTIVVKDQFARNQKSLAQVRNDVRAAISGFTGYSLRISEPADPLAGTSGRFQPVAVMVSGHDMLTLRDIARKVQAIMADIDGITDVAPLQEDGLPEIVLQTSPSLAGYYGVTGKSVGSELRTWVEGNTSNNLQIGSDRIPIRVRLAGGDQQSPQSLLAKSIYARPANGGDAVAVPIGSAVDWHAGAGPSIIARENRQKVLRVGANTARGAALGTIASELSARLRDLPLPQGYQVRIVGQTEQMAELFNSILVALALGCLFMYMILASLFESFTQPLTVMAAVPLAATGAVLALLAFQLPLDLYGGIGMILLAGIVAKNSILLVDFAMQKVREHNMEPGKAILEAAPLRLRPILMTSLAMIVGMLPVATGLGVGGAARQGLGVATIGGIISSTFLTLVIVPNLYVAIERFSRKFKKQSI